MTKTLLGLPLALGVLAAGTGARAGDLPADAAGVKTIADFVAAYSGEATLPSIEVKQDGSGYLVTFDVGAATAGLRGAGVTYEPAKYRLRVSHQDDGKWRAEVVSAPVMIGHMKDPKGAQIDTKVEYEGLTSIWVIDPKINWLSEGRYQTSKATITVRGPSLEEFVELKDYKGQAQTTSGPKGLTTVANGPVGHFNLVFDVDPKGVDASTGGPAKPVHVSVNADNVDVGVTLADFQPQPLLDAWQFVVKHPKRADYAHDFDGLKAMLAKLVADNLNLDEKVKAAKLDILTEAGTISTEGATIGVTMFNGPTGAGFGESFAAQTLKLPAGLVPPAFAALVPTSFDIAFKASGLDAAGAMQEWEADAKLEGTDPIVSKGDGDKIFARLFTSKPVTIDIAPSKIVAPSGDLAFEGKVTIDKGSATANLTLKAHNFDAMAAAAQAATPDKASELTPFFAMAKGLGKPQADGTLVWAYTLGPDKVMKVNGMPLGKAPF